MNGERSKAPVMGAPPVPSAESRQGVRGRRFKAAAKAEARLVGLVFNRCQAAIAAVCASSSVPAEFLGALVANESAGNPNAARFEPAVYRHLKALAAGAAPRYGAILPGDLSAEVEDMLHPKSDAFHGRFLTGPFGANHQVALAALADEALRELATSWGYTQIMGYHLVGRSGTVRDLLDPAFHFRLALELLADFIQEFQLDAAREFAELFRCWNTGQPYGSTFDPQYVERGLERMVLYRELAAAAARKPLSSPEAAKRP
jgi:hypothetical protein